MMQANEVPGSAAEIAASPEHAEIAARVKALLQDRFSLQLEQLTSERLLDELGIDSLAAIEFLFDLEQEFQITLTDDRAPIRTVGDIATLIERELVSLRVAAA